ncbi:MAG: hypothetical protein K2N05_10210 [Muribaculaceae bacterium]|nr:hypothetical protein [Muribaculaceae bacterium]
MEGLSKKNRDAGENEFFRIDLLTGALRCWEGLAKFREDRERCKRFTYGDQWSDLMPGEYGPVTEEEYIMSQGNVPLKNNLIRRMVRNVLGVFRNRWSNPQCVCHDPREETEASAMQRLIEYNIERNRLEEIYARTMEEFLISGLAVHRKWYGRKGRHTDCWTDFVSPDHFFFDVSARDFRNLDISIIGEIHDMDFDTLCATFAKEGYGWDELHDEYAPLRNDTGPFGCFPGRDSDRGMCKVIEVWTREYRQMYLCHDPMKGEYFRVSPENYQEIVIQENDRRQSVSGKKDKDSIINSRMEITEEWHYHFLTPSGRVLASGKSPYLHGRHPYIMKAYPFIDGEIHSFVADIIDQQKYTNRLISMYDWILRASAKGVLLFPEDALPKGGSMEEVVEEWSRFNGVLVYRPRTGSPLPQQIHANSANHGVADLLSIQLSMMENVSGVNSALQGKLESSSMSGTLFSQQTKNSLTALADLMKSYDNFILDATAVDASNIRQFYTPALIRSILGEENPLQSSEYFFDSSLDFSFTKPEE